ncbi:hypothetical protein ARMSODRAFT_950480 [Armillaria solidipes]|uniref:PQ-loop-domain-containing protein n=1 Tax=Armillaria solidipes TaxID=1076256 RepID=A0A2H3CLC6_9AGAR|nr:hypothetical protein ARMSODRAFT_950480 [Armillaria solidipes]
MSESCTPTHDWFTATLTFGLCTGLVISYVPQHLRIIQKGSSEGFSPWFLFLGSTSSASGLLNMVTMQWGIVRCCRFFSFGSCLEMTAGVIQVGLQWAMFTFIMVLYMIYYPPHLKYSEIDVDAHDSRPIHRRVKTPTFTPEWSQSIFLSWITVAHFAIITITTFFLLLTSPTPSASPPVDPTTPPEYMDKTLANWATFLGVSSALLAAIQYAPQIMHTWRARLVGALSIPMMLIQSPGAVLMVLSIALRPGTNWTSWITFAVAGMMQGTLLILCIMFKIRQRRLHIDDFGEPLTPLQQYSPLPDEMPGLVIGEGEDEVAVRVALASELESAVETDVRSAGVRPVLEIAVRPRSGEREPLLGERTAKSTEDGKSGGWFSWGR